MKQALAEPRRPKSRRKPDPAAIVAGQAKAIGLKVTSDRQGRVRIIGNAAELGKIRWRSPDLASQKLEILIGPVVRRPSASSTRENVVGSRGSVADPSTAHIERRSSEPLAASTSTAKSRALQRGQEIIDADLRTCDGVKSLSEVMNFLRVSRQTVDKKVKNGALLAVPGPEKERLYPACQFSREGVVPGLQAVLRALPSSDPWFRLNFLVNPEPKLAGRRPCDVLRDGNADEVIAAAERIAEMGA